MSLTQPKIGSRMRKSGRQILNDRRKKKRQRLKRRTKSKRVVLKRTKSKNLNKNTNGNEGPIKTSIMMPMPSRARTAMKTTLKRAMKMEKMSL